MRLALLGGTQTTYSLWNINDRNSHITLSGGNLTATKTDSNAHRGVRSTVTKLSGKWFWEITIGVHGGVGSNTIGVATSAAALTTLVGADAFGWGYLDTGQKETNGTVDTYGATYTAGDVIGVALDLDVGTLVFYKNGASQGTAYSGLSGAFLAMQTMYYIGDAVTANFGASAFAYSVPGGYNSGLFTTTV